MNETVGQLLDLAEDGIRLRGFHAVSFRDLADDLGIKSSSVHYYFPQKQDLGVALVERYSDAFFAALEQEARKSVTGEDYMNALCSVYREALYGSDRICLCGILGAESAGLPAEVSEAVSQFLNANIDWLAERLGRSDVARQKATQIVATLQGAMMLANALKDKSVFDNAINVLDQV